MRFCGIICEYNPFHNGHAFHISQSREITGADYVICAISGSFVQRGEAAVFNKWTRAACALIGGADAVIEEAYIGPYTSIGENVTIRRSEVEHSILLAGATVEDLGTRMEASLLGRDVRVVRTDGPPKTFRLLVGDRSEIEII